MAVFWDRAGQFFIDFNILTCYNFFNVWQQFRMS